MKTTAETRSLRKEARRRFVLHITRKLESDTSVEASALARTFMSEEQKLLDKLAHHAQYTMLVRMADDILKGSLTLEAAHEKSTQLVLPMSLKAYIMPGAYSFVGDAGTVKWVANYKAEIHHVLGHQSLQHRMRDAIVEATEVEDRALKVILRFWKQHPEIKPLGELLRLMSDEEDDKRKRSVN